MYSFKPVLVVPFAARRVQRGAFFFAALPLPHGPGRPQCAGTWAYMLLWRHIIAL